MVQPFAKTSAALGTQVSVLARRIWQKTGGQFTRLHTGLLLSLHPSYYFKKNSIASI